jgi:8-oxo-dGTP pyrophosphatase MutT (NUDIX family)
MTSDAWISDEPRLSAAVLGVISRARRRPLRVLALALISAAVLVAARAQRPPSHLATLHFRVAEGELADPGHAPVPPRAIREYIFHVALSRERVKRIMERHRWSSAYLARDPVAAIDEFREEIGIEVSRNYFVYDRRPWDEPRSAQVAISLMGSDAGKTRAVLHDVGEAILRDQQDHRAEHLARASEAVALQLVDARTRVNALQERIGRLQEAAAGAGGGSPVDAQARIATLRVEAAGAIERVVALEKRAAELGFSSAAEREQLGLVLELVDETVVAVAPSLNPWQLAGLGAIALVIALALAALLVGVFDDRVYGAADLTSHGLPAFGELPRFPGDDAGSYRAREGMRLA